MTTKNLHRLQAVVLDWSGTTVDYGCMAPAMVFVEVFKEQHIAISMEEARGPMGTYKRDHIRTLTQMPAIAERWVQAHGRSPDENDVQAMYEAFVPRQIEIITAYADLIPGAEQAVQAFRERGMKIGSCTGYIRSMMAPLVPEAAKRGYSPDAVVVPDDVPAGRPAPWMCYQNAIQLGVFPMASMIKIGDTMVDIEEGLNAGMWTIGLAKTGNELGLSEAEVNTLPPDELARRLEPIRAKMLDAGAHYVVDGLIDVLPLLDEIEARLRAGERP